MEVPGDYVCRLKKAISGLKTAPRRWAAKLKSVLEAVVVVVVVDSIDLLLDSDSDSIDLLPSYGVQSCWDNMSRVIIVT